MDPHKNLAYSLIATAPSPASSGTSLVVTAAQGTRFPAPPFNVTIWPTAAVPVSSNAEIARVTAISTDTFTIARAQEGTSARTVVVGDQIAATVTAKTLTDVESIGEVNITQASHGFAAGDVLYYTGSAYAKAKADAAVTAEVLGIVTASLGTNDFVMRMRGKVTGLSGLVAGSTYFLSPTSAGALTATEPTTVGHVSKPLLIADSTTTGYFFNMRGMLLDFTTTPDDLNFIVSMEVYA